MNDKAIVYKICDFLKSELDIDADRDTILLGKNATISSFSAMMLVAWCEDTFAVSELLEDDLFLESLSSVSSLSRQILKKGGMLKP